MASALNYRAPHNCRNSCLQNPLDIPKGLRVFSYVGGNREYFCLLGYLMAKLIRADVPWCAQFAQPGTHTPRTEEMGLCSNVRLH